MHIIIRFLNGRCAEEGELELELELELIESVAVAVAVAVADDDEDEVDDGHVVEGDINKSSSSRLLGVVIVIGDCTADEVPCAVAFIFIPFVPR